MNTWNFVDEEHKETEVVRERPRTIDEYRRSRSFLKRSIDIKDELSENDFDGGDEISRSWADGPPCLRDGYLDSSEQVAKREMRDLQERNWELEKRVQTLTRQVRAKNQQIECLMGRSDMLQAELNATVAEIVSIRTKYEDRDRELANLKRRLSEYEKEKNQNEEERRTVKCRCCGVKIFQPSDIVERCNGDYLVTNMFCSYTLGVTELREFNINNRRAEMYKVSRLFCDSCLEPIGWKFLTPPAGSDRHARCPARFYIEAWAYELEGDPPADTNQLSTNSLPFGRSLSD